CWNATTAGRAVSSPPSSPPTRWRAPGAATASTTPRSKPWAGGSRSRRRRGCGGRSRGCAIRPPQPPLDEGAQPQRRALDQIVREQGRGEGQRQALRKVADPERRLPVQEGLLPEVERVAERPDEHHRSGVQESPAGEV